jgi:hypothetical protein
MGLEGLDDPHEGGAATATDSRKDLAQRDSATTCESLDQEVDQISDIVAFEENPGGAALENDPAVVDKRLQAEQPIACLDTSGERVVHCAAGLSRQAPIR